MSVWLSSEATTVIPVPGRWYSASGISAPPSATPELALSIRRLLDCAIYSDTDPRVAANPTMPATLPVLPAPAATPTLAPLKGSAGDVSAAGFRSGARSAVVRARPSSSPSDWAIAVTRDGIPLTPDADGPLMVRLKGCGMWLASAPIDFPGITVRDGTSFWAKAGDAVVEIRGVAFANTAATEQWVLGRMEPFFERMGFMLGNLPLGAWEYGALAGDVAPKVPKFVSVMQTFGDKRLETHLLVGLERIARELPGVGPAVAACRSVYREAHRHLLEPVERAFPALRAAFAAEPESPLQGAFAAFASAYDAWGSFMVDAARKKLGLPSEREGLNGRLSWSYVKYAGVRKLMLGRLIGTWLHNLDTITVPGMGEEDLIREGFVPTEDILAVLDGDVRDFVRLFARLGWEAGRALAGVHRSGHLWGTFADHDQADLHCNAHTDNLIVLSPEIGKRPDGKYQLIAPVDFDMAFAKDQAVAVFDVEEPTPDPDIQVSQVSFEVTQFIQDLGGMTAVEVGISTAIQARPQPEGPNNIILWIARDVATWEAHHAYLAPLADRSEAIGLTADVAYSLVERALDLTRDCQS
jgi:hypothetical protein